MDLGAVRSAVAAAMTTAGIRAYAYVPDKPEPPCVLVAPLACEYDLTMGRSADTVTLAAVLLASHADDKAGQSTLDAFLGGDSLKTAVEADATLGGTADTCRVTGWASYGMREWAGVAYYAAELRIEVIG